MKGAPCFEAGCSFLLFSAPGGRGQQHHLEAIVTFHGDRIRRVFMRVSIQKPEFNGENPIAKDLEGNSRRLQIITVEAGTIV